MAFYRNSGRRPHYEAPTCPSPAQLHQPTSTSTTTRGGRSSQSMLHCVVRLRGRSVAVEHEVRPQPPLQRPPQRPPPPAYASKARGSSSHGRTMAPPPPAPPRPSQQQQWPQKNYSHPLTEIRATPTASKPDHHTSYATSFQQQQQPCCTNAYWTPQLAPAFPAVKSPSVLATNTEDCHLAGTPASNLRLLRHMETMTTNSSSTYGGSSMGNGSRTTVPSNSHVKLQDRFTDYLTTSNSPLHPSSQPEPSKPAMTTVSTTSSRSESSSSSSGLHTSMIPAPPESPTDSQQPPSTSCYVPGIDPRYQYGSLPEPSQQRAGSPRRIRPIQGEESSPHSQLLAPAVPAATPHSPTSQQSTSAALVFVENAVPEADVAEDGVEKISPQQQHSSWIAQSSALPSQHTCPPGETIQSEVPEEAPRLNMSKVTSLTFTPTTNTNTSSSYSTSDSSNYSGSSLGVSTTYPDIHDSSQFPSSDACATTTSPSHQPPNQVDSFKQEADTSSGEQSHTQLAPETHRLKILKVTSWTNAVTHFHVHDIRGDGDCGFYATGISRKKFTQKLVGILLNQEEEEEEQNTLTPTQEATVRALLTESAKAEASRLEHPEIYYVDPSYCAAFQRVFPPKTYRDADDSKMFDDASLVRFVTEVMAFVSGECHPYYATSSDLRLMSLLFKVRIHVYEALELEFDELTPDNHILCVFDDSEAKGADRDLYLICTGGNHFDKLMPVENDVGMEAAPVSGDDRFLSNYRAVFSDCSHSI